MSDALPPLPEPDGAIDVDDGPYTGEGAELPHMQGARVTRCADGYSGEAMRAYGRACALAERERADQDAKRYRWLRINSTGPVEPWSTHSNPESLDAIVDSAIRAAPQPEKS